MPTHRRMSASRGRRRTRRGILAAGLILLVAAGLMVPRLLNRGSGTPRPATPGDAPSSPTASPTSKATAPHEVFAGFWPATDFASAEAIQKEVDAGHQPWRLDPRLMAERFAAEFVRWPRVEILDSGVRGSASAGWEAGVRLRPFVGEAGNLQPGNLHVLELVGLDGEKQPAWFVSSLRSDEIIVSAPKRGEVVSSPLEVSGRGIGFEANLPVEILNDKGVSLHPQPGFVMGGAYEATPFSGKLSFDPPGTPGGIVIVTGDTGAEGPPPDWTIVRVVFAGV